MCYFITDYDNIHSYSIFISTIRFCSFKFLHILLQVTWLKNGSPVRMESARVSLTPSGALEIEPLKHHDAALYRCRVALLHSPHIFKWVKIFYTHNLKGSVQYWIGFNNSLTMFLIFASKGWRMSDVTLLPANQEQQLSGLVSIAKFVAKGWLSN